MWKSAGRAPSLRVLPWHLPYNWGKKHGKPSVRVRKTSVRVRTSVRVQYTFTTTPTHYKTLTNTYIKKPTHTHTLQNNTYCFSLQQWLHESASMLRYSTLLVLLKFTYMTFRPQKENLQHTRGAEVSPMKMSGCQPFIPQKLEFPNRKPVWGCDSSSSSSDILS
jgi:hypothetical protein